MAEEKQDRIVFTSDSFSEGFCDDVFFGKKQISEGYISKEGYDFRLHLFMDNGEHKVYHLFWDYGDYLCTSDCMNRNNPIFLSFYDKWLYHPNDNVYDGKFERFLLYDPDEERFVIVIVTLNEQGNSIYGSMCYWRFSKTNFDKYCNRENNNCVIDMKRPFNLQPEIECAVKVLDGAIGYEQLDIDLVLQLNASICVSQSDNTIGIGRVYDKLILSRHDSPKLIESLGE